MNEVKGRGFLREGFPVLFLGIERERERDKEPQRLGFPCSFSAPITAIQLEGKVK